MERIALAKTGLELSPLGMGTVPMCTRIQGHARVDLVRAVMDLGINWFDTSRNYGDAEEVLGEAFEGVRDQVVIISKSGARDADTLRQHLAVTLQGLRSDYLDVFLFHGGGALKQESFFAPGGLLETVEDARSAGKVRFLGFSAHNVELAVKALDVVSFDFAMVPANFMSVQYIEGEFMAKARQRGVTVLAMKPFGGGRLENARLCLKFLKGYPGVLPCVGVQRIAEMEENVHAWEGGGALTPADRAEMKRIRATLGDRFCRQCGYCVPCPNKVDIMSVNMMQAWVEAALQGGAHADIWPRRGERQRLHRVPGVRGEMPV